MNFLEKVDWKWGKWRPRVPQAPEGHSCGMSLQAELFARHPQEGSLTPGLRWGYPLQARCYDNLCRGLVTAAIPSSSFQEPPCPAPTVSLWKENDQTHKSHSSLLQGNLVSLEAGKHKLPLTVLCEPGCLLIGMIRELCLKKEGSGTKERTETQKTQQAVNGSQDETRRKIGWLISPMETQERNWLWNDVTVFSCLCVHGKCQVKCSFSVIFLRKKKKGDVFFFKA